MPHPSIKDRSMLADTTVAPLTSAFRGSVTCRDAMWSMVICGIDPDPGKAAALRQWGRNYWEAVHPFNPGGGYVNFMMEDELVGRLQATYGENCSRLVDAKKKYDPANLFRVNHNIRPAA
jgi:hypothetical protein